MEISDIKHEILRTKWIIDTTKNPKCRNDHKRHLKKLERKLYSLLNKYEN